MAKLQFGSLHVIFHIRKNRSVRLERSSHSSSIKSSIAKMFMPQQPKLTPEQKAMLRLRTIGTVTNFVTVVAALRAVPFVVEYAKKFF
ncbi:hypothetical protein VTP01DRAFT_7553 [Rhizomucor pusillus]|uniref:uncharacterized protein n=1 Tax=Rhizomucor pusillus TaxID=4840 RepID=UPI003743089C